MCGGGGGHTVRDPYRYPTRPTPWGQALGGHGRITGRQATEVPMCIITSGGDRGGSPQATAHWYRQQQRKGGWLFDRAGALLARLGAHPLGEVVAGRLTLTDWARFELTPAAHEDTCRYRRACARLGWT